MHARFAEAGFARWIGANLVANSLKLTAPENFKILPFRRRRGLQENWERIQQEYPARKRHNELRRLAATDGKGKRGCVWAGRILNIGFGRSSCDSCERV
jgi:hypothetical protein